VTPFQVVLGVLVGLVAGIGSGLFGVGGGVVTTRGPPHAASVMAAEVASRRRILA
jgi:uncharacterized membrane protein YfcA